MKSDVSRRAASSMMTSRWPSTAIQARSGGINSIGQSNNKTPGLTALTSQASSLRFQEKYLSWK
jgi:hypothetical protein